jgi:hypothetical protein
VFEFVVVLVGRDWLGIRAGRPSAGAACLHWLFDCLDCMSSMYSTRNRSEPDGLSLLCHRLPSVKEINASFGASVRVLLPCVSLDMLARRIARLPCRCITRLPCRRITILPYRIAHSAIVILHRPQCHRHIVSPWRSDLNLCDTEAMPSPIYMAIPWRWTIWRCSASVGFADVVMWAGLKD